MKIVVIGGTGLIIRLVSDLGGEPNGDIATV